MKTNKELQRAHVTITASDGDTLCFKGEKFILKREMRREKGFYNKMGNSCTTRMVLIEKLKQ